MRTVACTRIVSEFCMNRTSRQLVSDFVTKSEAANGSFKKLQVSEISSELRGGGSGNHERLDVVISLQNKHHIRRA